jgi:ubiquitin C-terminal hydrolase
MESSMFSNIRAYIPLKIYRLYGVICHRAELFIISNVRTSNATQMKNPWERLKDGQVQIKIKSEEIRKQTKWDK